MKTAAFGAATASAPIAPMTVDRREPRANDVVIDIRYCGICHSDVHQARDEWGGGIFPMVPGHEIVGHVASVGAGVTKWKVGDAVGVGCMVDSCRTCAPCVAGDEQYCERGASWTYNGREQDGTPTYGGYSARIVVDERYVVRIPSKLPLDRAAPLLCAGITTYSPMRHFGVKAGDRVGIVGLGGLGHCAVKIAAAMGAHVTMLSHSPRKRDDAAKLGAKDFLVTSDKKAMAAAKKTFDFLLDTVSAQHDYGSYLDLLKLDGTMVLVGVPEPTPLSSTSLIFGRRRLAGSLIGGIRETQEMLDFCAEHDVAAEIELIKPTDVDAAYERMLKSDVRYRFVIDLASLPR